MIKPDRMYWLDRWRVIATIYVAIFHSAGYLDTYGKHSPILISNILSKGYIGTSFFMILSGFIITLIFKDKVSAYSDRYSFWRSRIVRIYPIYFIVMIFGFINIYRSTSFSFFDIPNFAMNITLTMSYFPTVSRAYVETAWTLCTLFLFYFIFPFIIDSFRKLKKVTLIRIITLIWMIYIAIPFIYILIFPNQIIAPMDIEPAIFSYLHYFPPLRIAEPVLGMLLALYLQSKPNYYFNTYRKIYTLSLTILIVSLFLPTKTTFFPALHNGLYIPLLFCLMASRYRMGQLNAKTDRLFNYKLSDATLTLYLTHPFLEHIFIRLTINSIPTIILIIVSTVFATIVGFYIHKLITIPLSKGLNNA